MKKIELVVVWVVKPCNDVVGGQRFGEARCLHLQGDDGRSIVAYRNAGVLPHHYMASDPRRSRLDSVC